MLVIMLCLYAVALMFRTYFVMIGYFRAVRMVAEAGFIRLIRTRNGLFYASVYVVYGLI